MGFIMRYYINTFKNVIIWLCLCMAFGLAGVAHAQTVENITPFIGAGPSSDAIAVDLNSSPDAGAAHGRDHGRDPRDEKLFINADIDFELSDELREVALKGVPLHFTADVEITSQRWWWFDKTEIKESQTWRVVYNALTRQWRVGSGDLLLPESSLADAMYPMRHIRDWAVAYVIDLDPDKTYHGRLRLRLDTSLLTRPLQVDALNGRAWSLATPWKNFSFSVDALQP